MSAPGKIDDATGGIAPSGAPPLFGLVLAGGRSTRMRQDKAALSYGGRTQLERAMALLTPHVERARWTPRGAPRAC